MSGAFFSDRFSVHRNPITVLHLAAELHSLSIDADATLHNQLLGSAAGA